MERARSKLSETDKAITELDKQRRATSKELQDAEVACKKLTNSKSRLDRELSEANEVYDQRYGQQNIILSSFDFVCSLKRLLAQHKWIKSAESTFGVPGTVYSFSSGDMKDVVDRVEKLREVQSRLRNQVNMKAMAMLEAIKTEHDDLLKKKAIVEKDKSTILQSIDELDKKKAEALEKTYSQVNQDFGSVFSTLLPGTQARLEPPPGMTIQEGLQVRVAFGNTWKESLTELSGGQRYVFASTIVNKKRHQIH